jgi:hypothetical protein
LRQTNSLSFVFIGSEKEKENKKNNRIRPFWLFKMQNERNAFDNVKTTKTIGFALYLPGILQTRCLSIANVFIFYLYLNLSLKEEGWCILLKRVS